MREKEWVRVVRLTGIREFDLHERSAPRAPEPGEVRIAVGAVGICGSDLHLYENGHIGSTVGEAPFVLGHEFMGTVLDVHRNATDGEGRPLRAGTRVAVDPQIPCHDCEWCRRGDTNLCPNHQFMGLYPTDGALQESMLVPARNCFPLPDDITDAAGAVLETLGVALHAVDLAKLRRNSSCIVIGCGAVGLLILRLARLAGANPLIAVDPLPWRTALAQRWGATELVNAPAAAAADAVRRVTGGRGCDVVFEAAWVGLAAEAAMEFACPGGKVVLVGIPGEDTISFPHSVARRKGLTLLFSRRMRAVYPRAIAVTSGKQPAIDLDNLVTHTFPLEKTPEAFALTAAYREGVIKTIIHPNSRNPKMHDSVSRP